MRSITALAVAASLLGTPVPGRAGDERTRETARKVMGQYGPSLAMVRLTVKYRMVIEGREQSGPESTMEAGGTLVSPDGLTIVSDFTTQSPATLFRGAGGPHIESDVRDVKLVLQDGRELPARFVLRDGDLDVAFVAPTEPCGPLPVVRFEKGPVPAPLDDLIMVSLLGKTLGREVAVSTARVRAVVKKPRTFVVPTAGVDVSNLGSPAFDEKGRPVGLVLLRRTPASAEEMVSLRSWSDRLTPVVLTAGDIQDLVTQATAARAKSSQREGDGAP